MSREGATAHNYPIVSQGFKLLLSCCCLSNPPTIKATFFLSLFLETKAPLKISLLIIILNSNNSIFIFTLLSSHVR